MSNAIYNAARHTIETRDGSMILATLHPSVRADHAFQIADSWQGPGVEDYEMIEEDLEIQREKTGEAKADAEMFKNMHRNADHDLTKANARIAELEAELGLANPDEVLRDVLRELSRARQKFPLWPDDPLHAAAVIGEEHGELTRALLELNYEPNKGGDLESVRKEAVQLAAMALRFLYSMGRYVFRPSTQHQQKGATTA